jgi:4-diphosphocytidyl-2C-methyl-D-erythritol kinase
MPVPVHMTGSGSALFVLCDSESDLTDLLTPLPPDLRQQFLMVRNNPV